MRKGRRERKVERKGGVGLTFRGHKKNGRCRRCIQKGEQWKLWLCIVQFLALKKKKMRNCF